MAESFPKTAKVSKNASVLRLSGSFAKRKVERGAKRLKPFHPAFGFRNPL
jgi:hypothetical protein